MPLCMQPQGRPPAGSRALCGRCLSVTSCLTPGCTGPWHTLWRGAFLETECPGGSPSPTGQLRLNLRSPVAEAAPPGPLYWEPVAGVPTGDCLGHGL